MIRLHVVQAESIGAQVATELLRVSQDSDDFNSVIARAIRNPIDSKQLDNKMKVHTRTRPYPVPAPADEGRVQLQVQVQAQCVREPRRSR